MRGAFRAEGQEAGTCLGEPFGGGAQPPGGRVWAGGGLEGRGRLDPVPAPRPSAAAEAGLQQRRVCALHLRRYNDALLVHDTVRAVDALDSLRDFYDRERTTKTQVLQAERWLLALFDGEARGNWTRQGTGADAGWERALEGAGALFFSLRVKAVDRTKDVCPHL